MLPVKSQQGLGRAVAPEMRIAITGVVLVSKAIEAGAAPTYLALTQRFDQLGFSDVGDAIVLERERQRGAEQDPRLSHGDAGAAEA